MKKNLSKAASLFALAAWFAPPAFCADIAINQHDQQFLPSDVVIKQGDTLVFSNTDNTTHNIQVVNSDGDAQDKGLQRPGEIVKHTFTKAGSYEVRCMIHPDMLLTIIVK